MHLLKAGGLPFEMNTTGQRLNKAQVIDLVGRFDGVIAGLEPYDSQVLEALPRLKCISRCGVGLDNIDLAAAEQKGIKVFCTPDAVTAPVVELTVGLILNLLRRLCEHNALMGQGKWQRLMGQQLAGKTVGIVGLGRIGRRVAQALTALGARVVGCDIQPDASWAKGCGVSLVTLEELLTQCDIVTLHLSGGACEGCLLTQRHFQSMKPGALIVNTSRGGFLDEAALLAALQQGHLAGAALDVFAKEPYQGPLAGLPNVILTPHIGTFTKQARAQMEIEAVENAVRFLQMERAC